MTDDLSATASFYNAVSARYDAEMDRPSANAAQRDAFRARVSAAAGTGNPILDFGCGTGTDASWYAGRGHRVVAYDISSGMVAALRERCAREIAEGRIQAIEGDLGKLLEALKRTGPVAVVAANFAVLNHVRDLHPLLRALSPHLVPDGRLFACVLNPFYRRDMTARWWWRGLPASLLTGAIRFAGEVTTYRHYMHAVRRMASPLFALVEWSGASRAQRPPSGSPRFVLATLDDNFLFLVLRKRQ